MRVTRALPVVTSIALFAAVACDDSTAPPAPGAIRAFVAASGHDITTDDLRVSVTSGPVLPVSQLTLDVVISGLTPGVHAMRLEGMRANCHVSGDNPRSVTVASQDTTIVFFDMVCAPRTGSVRVTTVTTGADIDPDGYIALVSDGTNLPVPANGVTTLPNIRFGLRTITLDDVVPNCRIAGSDVATVTVQDGATVDVAFTVECVAFGTLEVTVSTTGINLDPTGYLVEVRSTSADFSGLLEVATNGSVSQSRLPPATDYRITLSSLTTNCDVAGADTQTVVITAGVTTPVAFDVVCEAPSLLAFTRDGDIYTITAEGADLTRLTTDPGDDGDAAWSSTGRIAFSTLRHSNDPELYVMNEDGSNEVRLTESAGADDAPSWSPDGQRIVFRSFRDVNSELYVINADGSGLTRLTNNEAIDYAPAWSTTGKIAFISNRDHASGEIYVMSEDGSNVVRLTHNDSVEISPAWSPDGSRIAFARQVECAYGCTSDLFVMNADGSNVTRLQTAWSTYQNNTDPAWSPNGRAITYTSHYCAYYYCDPPSVWLLDLQSSVLIPVAQPGTNAVWRP